MLIVSLVQFLTINSVIPFNFFFKLYCLIEYCTSFSGVLDNARRVFRFKIKLDLIYILQVERQINPLIKISFLFRQIFETFIGNILCLPHYLFKRFTEVEFEYFLSNKPRCEYYNVIVKICVFVDFILVSNTKIT